MIVDTLTTMTSTSQLIVTSAHCTAIAKALDCKEYVVTILLMRPGFFTLSMCTFGKNASYEKFHDAAFFAREIVDDCLQVRIFKNLMLHAS